MHPAAVRRGFFPQAPALGEHTRLGRGQFIFRLVLVLAAGAVLGAQLSGVVNLKSHAVPAPPLDAVTVAFNLVRGARPTDADLIALHSQYRVAAVVNITGPNVEERVVTKDLGLDYLELSLGGVPAASADQLGQVVTFIDGHLSKGDVVYLHDDTGHRECVALTAMLLLLRGQPLAEVLEAMPTDEYVTLTGARLTALRQLAAAKSAHSADSPVPADNPYAGAAALTW
jgi:hypothetical protein